MLDMKVRRLQRRQTHVRCDILCRGPSPEEEVSMDGIFAVQLAFDTNGGKTLNFMSYVGIYDAIVYSLY